MIVIKVPAGWTPEWPAFPIDPPRAPCPVDTDGDGDCAACARNPGIHGVLDLTALLGPKDCERCANETTRGWIERDSSHGGGLLDRCDCVDGKVPQRVALAIERPCETCGGEHPGPEATHGEHWNCLDFAKGARIICYDGVRLRVEYTAQVDAVVPIVDHDDMETRPIVLHWGARCIHYDGELEHELGDCLGDWSPGRWAVLTSDVQRVGEAIGVPTAFKSAVVPLLRPFDGPIANLEDVPV